MSLRLLRKIRFSAVLIAVALVGVIGYVEPAAALSEAQHKLNTNGIWYFDAEAQAACGASSSTSSNASGTSGASGEFTSDQVKAFMHQPITATWNISDKVVEEWFLKQSNTKSAVSRFGLTSSNMGEITAAVKAAGVSPVFFYTYAVNEGPIWGFINHFSGGDAPGGGVANAKRDAEYIATTAASVGKFNPAWYDLDNPQYKGPPADIQAAGNADFKSMPAGSIGIIYIPATAATTWEVYYPDALKGSVNGVQNYGAPLQGMMKNIQRMGGDPMQGGVAVSATGCTPATGVTGEGMQKAISFVTAIANNNGYGYDQYTRETGLPKWQSDPNCTDQCGSFDCSSLISAALTLAGYFSTNPNFATIGEASALTGAGFTKVADSAATSEGLLPGDVLLANGHTEMYIGNNQLVGAHIDENGGIGGGQTGDQTGKEISVGPFYSHPWNGVFRAQK